MVSVVVTGANGFIGRHVVRRLAERHQIRCAIRSVTRALSEWEGRCSVTPVGTLSGSTDWRPALEGVEVVVHLAALAHRQRPNPAEVREANVEVLRNLLGHARLCGVRRLVLVSSIGVHGAQTDGEPFDEQSPLRPYDCYTRSKAEAEQVLGRASGGWGLESVIVRPPLVYGPGAPGNLERLVRWTGKGVPLPFGSIRNKRSFIGVDNLADFLCLAVEESAMAGQTYVISDGEDVSTPELIRKLAGAMGVNPRLANVPPRLLRMILAAAGRSSDYVRLCESLQVNSGKARRLGWQPSRSLDEGLRRIVDRDPNREPARLR